MGKSIEHKASIMGKISAQVIAWIVKPTHASNAVKFTHYTTIQHCTVAEIQQASTYKTLLCIKNLFCKWHIYYDKSNFMLFSSDTRGD